MIERWRTMAVLILMLTGATVSGTLLLRHYGHDAGPLGAICGAEDTSGCAAVDRSPYSEFHGIPLAALGVLFYLSLADLLLLALLAGAETQAGAAFLAFCGLALGLLIDLMLLGAQAFAIHAFCKLCLATYLVTLAGLVLLLPARRGAGSLRPALAGVDGRLVLAGWALGTIALVALPASSALARPAGPPEAMLGPRTAPAPAPAVTTVAAPLPAPTLSGNPEPVASAARPPAGKTAAGAPASEEARRYQEQAQKAQDEAKRLQETLDDPKKLEQYFADKSMKEFEQAQIQNIDLASVPFKGPAEAPLKVVEFSDFLCPWCRSLAGAFASYLPQSAGRVAVYFKNYPLDVTCNDNIRQTVHPGACNLALGAVCANDQGKFWPYHDKVFSTQAQNPQPADVLKLGGEAGLDMAALESCLAAPRTRDRLKAQIGEGGKVGVQGTPSVFVNGKKLGRIDFFNQVVEKESKRLGLPPLPPPPAAPKTP